MPLSHGLDVGLIKWIESLAQGLKDPPFSANQCPGLRSNTREDYCDTSGVSTFKYNSCTLVKVKGKFGEINSKRKGKIKDESYKRN